MFADKLFKDGDKFNFGGVKSGSESFVLSEFTNAVDKNLLIVVKDIASEKKLITELNFYNPHLEILHFANYEVLAYDNSTPHIDIISNRLKTLNQLQNTNNKTVVITTIETLFSRIPPLEFINSRSFLLKIGDTININEFAENLTTNGYLRVNKVQTSGEFSVKGSIVDIFAMGQKSHDGEAVRIDLFDNEIEEIRILILKRKLQSKK